MSERLEGMDRRAFVKSTVAAGAALALSGSLGRLAWSGSVSAKAVSIKAGSAIHITIPESPTPMEKRASALMSRIVGEVFGMKLEVRNEAEMVRVDAPVIAIGRTRAAENIGLRGLVEKSGKESIGHGVLPEKNLICVVGADDLGVYHAAARFLEKYVGVRWYFPDELGLVVPSKTSVEVPAGTDIQSPEFSMRWIGKPQVADWALFNGLNTNLDEKAGFHVFESAHTFHAFIPPVEYFKTHPEYFSEVNGKRDRKQLCTSNPQVIDLVSRAMIRMFDEKPELDMITLFPEDGRFFCECRECRALDTGGAITVSEVNARKKGLGPEWQRALSRRMTIFYLAVTRKVLAAKPSKKIQVGAYSAYLLPPKSFEEKAPGNVYILMCHGSCHNHSLDSDTCEINLRFREGMRGWRNIYSGMDVYEYYRKAAMLEFPFPILHSIKRDIPFYKKEGVFGLYTQFSRDYYTNGLNYYLASRLLQNSKEDADEILLGFFKSFYGRAWKPMKDYWDNYEQAAIRANIHLACPVNQMDLIFSNALLGRQTEMLAEALKEADSIQVRKRIERAKVSLDYLKMCMGYLSNAKEIAAEMRNEKAKARRRDVKELNKMAEGIRRFWESNRESNCFGAGQTNYLKRFFKPVWLVNNIMKLEDVEEEMGE